MRRILLLSLGLLICHGSMADDSLWTDLDNQQSDLAARGVITSDRYNSRQLTLDESGLLNSLQNAPLEPSGNLAARSDSNIVVSLPLPDGTFAEVQAFDSPVMEAGLAEQLPEVSTWRVFGTDGKVMSGRIGMTDKGLHATLTMSDGDVVYIDAEDIDGERLYHTLSHTDNAHKAGVFNCGVPGHDHSDSRNIISEMAARVAQTPGNQVREYRLAVAAAPAFTAVAGGTTDSVAASIATVVNRLNEIYQRDVGIQFKLVASNNDLIFGASDVARTMTQAYTSANNNAMLTQNKANINAALAGGSADYDVGHVFNHTSPSSSSGLALESSVCGADKAQGVSGFLQFLDGFAANMVAHELAHQFSASHTYNASSGSCSTRSSTTAYEPGSGTSIMSYAGVCSDADNVQASADGFFHGGSIKQITDFVSSAAGSSCGSVVTVANAAPEAEAGSDFSIPKSTPFVLSGTGTDADGDTLTYSWEQYNASTAAANLSAGDTGTNAIFRSRSPSTVGTRHIPSLNGQYNGSLDKGEFLPAVARSGGNALKMILTVRDQKYGADIDDMAITVAATGPFEITSHATAVTMVAGSSQTVEWDTAGTNASCPAVSINLLIGDPTYGDAVTPVELAATETNDGSAVVTIPSGTAATGRARFQVKCNNNIFYALSKVNLGVTDAAQAGQDPSNPIYTVSAVQQVEGTLGLSHLKFRINISPPYAANANKVGARIVHVDTDAADFSSTISASFFGTSVVVPPIEVGASFIDMHIPINTDSDVEPNETFSLKLFSLNSTATAFLSNSAIAEAVMTIKDDDAQGVEATIAAPTAVITEGDSGTSNAIFTVTLKSAPTVDVTVNFATTAGTATETADFTPTSGQLTFTAGTATLSQTISVPVVGDLVYEGNESFSVVLSEPSTGVQFAGNASTISVSATITENEAVPTLSIDSQSLAEGNVGDTPVMTFNVTLSGETQSNVTFDYATADVASSAVAGTDYTAVTTTPKTITAGQTSTTLTVSLIGDALVEAGNETFNVVLSNPTIATIATGTGVGTIEDDEIITASIAAATLSESAAGTSTLDFIVTLSSAPTAAVTVDYATSNGTGVSDAVAGTDYTSTAGTLTIAANTTTGTISVPVLADAIAEENETLTMTLSNPLPVADLAVDTNAASAVGTITNDDAHAIVNASIDATKSVSESATDVTFAVTLATASTQTVTVDYATAGGTATEGTDYTAKTGTLTFVPGGPLSQNIVVSVTNDTDFEVDEAFTVVLSNPKGLATQPGGAANPGLTIVNGTGTATITNDDDNTVSIADATVSEGGTSVTLTLTLEGDHVDTATPLTVQYTTSDGPAVAGAVGAGDFEAVTTAQTVTFTAVAGTPARTQTISININEDTLNEGNETFTVNLGTTSAGLSIGSAAGAGSATVTITDNDISIVSIASTATVVESGNASFDVTISPAATVPVTVNYTTADGTATAGSDYTANTAGSIIIPANTATGQIVVPVSADTTVEADETFTVTLSSVTPAADAQLSTTAKVLTATITNDDKSSASVSNVTAAEGDNLVFTVELDQASLTALTVDYATSDGTATTGNSDYTATSGQLSFGIGDTSKTVTVATTSDLDTEPNETVNFTLTIPAGVTELLLGTATATGTINNDDTDTDSDGLSDAQEANLGTDPQLADTDGDGDNDGVEVGSDVNNPTDTDSDGLIDALVDNANENVNTAVDSRTYEALPTVATELGLTATEAAAFKVESANGEAINACGGGHPITTEGSSDVSTKAQDADYDFPQGLFHVCVGDTTTASAARTLTLTYPKVIPAGYIVRILTLVGSDYIWEELPNAVINGSQVTVTLTDTVSRTARRVDIGGTSDSEQELILGIAKRVIVTGNATSGGGSMSLIGLLFLSMFTLLCVARRRRSVTEL